MQESNWINEVLGGRYRVESRLAVGGMGEVYRAEDLSTGEQVAVKVPHAYLSSDPTFAGRLLREAQTVAGLSHANVVRLLASGEHAGSPYLVMELVDGPSLAEVLRREGTLAPGRALAIARGVLSALAHAHGHGVVHRDVKPGNVLLGPNDTVKLVDFGIAHAQAQSAATFTATGELLGSLHYLAPERLSGQPATTAADLYGAGVILYQMLTGQLPFPGDVPAVVAAQQLQSEPLPPSRLRPGLPPALDAVVLRALAKDPHARYANAESMLAELDNLEHNLSEAVTSRFSPPVASAPHPVTGWLAQRLRPLVLAGALFAAVGLAYAVTVDQPEPALTAAPTQQSATATVQPATPSPSPTAAPPTPTPIPRAVAPVVQPLPNNGNQNENRAEQAEKKAEKQKEKDDKKRGRD